VLPALCDCARAFSHHHHPPLPGRGIGAAGATADHDARIFSLATLLTSLLLYNSLGPIDEEAITVRCSDAVWLRLRWGGGCCLLAPSQTSHPVYTVVRLIV